MTDIVERLRNYAKTVLAFYPNDVCSEAADEIERLQDALKEIDTAAIAKRAGAAKKMQAIARNALKQEDAE